MFGPKTWLTLVEVTGLRCGVGASSWDCGFVPPGKEGDAERLCQPLPSAREPKASLPPQDDREGAAGTRPVSAKSTCLPRVSSGMFILSPKTSKKE